MSRTEKYVIGIIAIVVLAILAQYLDDIKASGTLRNTALGIVAVVGIGIYWKYNQSKRVKFAATVKKLGVLAQFPCGLYLYGMKQNTGKPPVICLVTKDSISIVTTAGDILGEIQKKAITEIKVEDRSTFEKRVTATRLILLNIFAFAFRKTKLHNRVYLSVEYKSGAVSNQVVFKFSSMTTASAASQQFAKQLERITPATQPRAESDSGEIAKRLRNLDRLKQSGTISEEEYNRQREKIIGSV